MGQTHGLVDMRRTPEEEAEEGGGGGGGEDPPPPEGDPEEEGDEYMCITYGICSPLLLDLGPGGLCMSRPNVPFDFWGNGEVSLFSWPTAKSGNGWLVLDRNGDGEVNDGRELFGNATPLSFDLSGIRAANGFAALAWFDLRSNGGNSDGWIDENDGIWPRLQVWIDANHNGVSEMPELQPVWAAGVVRIAIRPNEKNRHDRWGNWFRYRAPLILRDTSGKLRRSVLFDVYLALWGLSRLDRRSDGTSGRSGDPSFALS